MRALAAIAVLLAGPATALEWAEPGSVFFYEYRAERPVASSGCGESERVEDGFCVTTTRLRQEVLAVDGHVITWAEESSQPPRPASHFTIRVSDALVVGQRYMVASHDPNGETSIVADVEIHARPVPIPLFPLEDDTRFEWVEEWAGPAPREVKRVLSVSKLEEDPFDLTEGPLWRFALEEVTEGSVTRLWIDPAFGWPVRIEHVYQDGELGSVRAVSTLTRVEQP